MCKRIPRILDEVIYELISLLDVVRAESHKTTSSTTTSTVVVIVQV